MWITAQQARLVRTTNRQEKASKMCRKRQASCAAGFAHSEYTHTGKDTHQDRTVLLLEDGKLVDVLAVLNSLHNVSKLSINIGGAANTLQAAAGLLDFATVHQTVGGVRDDEGSQEQDEGRHNGQTHRQTPSVGVHVLGAIVDPLSYPDTDGGGHLEHDVQSTTGMGRCNLRQVERHSLQQPESLSAMGQSTNV